MNLFPLYSTYIYIFNLLAVTVNILFTWKYEVLVIFVSMKAQNLDLFA